MNGGDEAAFAALVHRHGRLVRAVCRRVLRRAEDVDDAFQATLFVFARRAGSIRRTESVASWLYGVAYRTAMNARRSIVRRSRVLPKSGRSPERPLDEVALRELQTMLDDEVRRLPEKYRSVFVLCCLDGRGKAEAARELGWKEGTVSGRLDRARRLLRQRLARRGVALPAGLCALAMVPDGASAVVSGEAVRGVLACARGEPGRLSSAVTTLARGVLRDMATAKAKGLTAVILAAGFAMGGAGLAARQAMSCGPINQSAAAARESEAGAHPASEAGLQASVASDRYGDRLPAGVVARLGTGRYRHDDWIVDAAVSGDGRVLAGGFHGSVGFWDLATGKELTRLQLPFVGGPNPVALSPDGKILAIATGDGIVRLWDVRRRTVLHELVGHRSLSRPPGPRDGGIRQVLFAADGTTLASLGADQTIRVWDVPTGRTRYQLDAPAARALVFTARGKTLLAGGEGGADAGVLLGWAVRSGKLLWRREVAAAISSLAVSPDEKTVAAGTWGPKDVGDIFLWDAATGRELRRLRGHRAAPGCVAFSADGGTLASAVAYPESALRLWDVGSGTEKRRIPAPGATRPCLVNQSSL